MIAEDKVSLDFPSPLPVAQDGYGVKPMEGDLGVLGGQTKKMQA